MLPACVRGGVDGAAYREQHGDVFTVGQTAPNKRLDERTSEQVRE